MAYVDGFVAAVEEARKQDYIDHAREAADIFKRHGALDVVECWGDDVPEGEVTSFPMAVARKQGEVVVFSWIMWPDKAAREAGWEKTMADMEKANLSDMPFDGQRMIYGGFETILKV